MHIDSKAIRKIHLDLQEVEIFKLSEEVGQSWFTPILSVIQEILWSLHYTVVKPIALLK